MVRIAFISLLLLLQAGCNRATRAEFDEIPPESTVSVAYLKSRCNDPVSVAITEDLSIIAQVVANDLYGEFHHEIVVQDDSGGITIDIDRENLFESFPIGARLLVRCNGLRLRNYGGKIRLGIQPDPLLGEDGIPADEIDRYIRILCRDEKLPHTPSLTFGMIQDRHIDTRVRFDRVRFADADQRWCDMDPLSGRYLSSEREIIDEAGNRFRVRTLWCCKYADELLPKGQGSLFGVIDCFGGVFSLRVTTHEIVFSQQP